MGELVHTYFKPVIYLLLLLSCINASRAYVYTPDEDRYVDREFLNPSSHQLTNWILSQLRKGEMDSAVISIPYRVPISTGKRNSELTSSIMGIPRTMIDNGR